MSGRITHYGFIFLVLLSIVGTAYFGVSTFTRNPCAVPKTWSIGRIDSQFGISKATVKLYTEQAAKTWNNAYANNPLLTYTEAGGDIVITFVYDERQRTTIQNERLKQTIETEKSELDDLKRTIESLRTEYDALEKTINIKMKAYTELLTQYNNEVNYWNSRGGAPADDYQRLEREGVALETERITLNANISRYNQLGDLIRNYGRDHNQVVETINNKIETLNQTAIRDFEEGTYDPNTHTITIYEYADATALKRVLTHELGHAIGLGHVEDKDAIMYAVNQGKNLNLSEADKEELGNICKEKSLSDIVTALRTTRDDISHLLLSSLRDRAVPAK